MKPEPEKVFPHTPYVPFDPNVALYEAAGWASVGGEAVPWEHTGWRDEVMSWKKTAYIHGHLNPTPTVLPGAGVTPEHGDLSHGLAVSVPRPRTQRER